jgi:hypothetical protein
MLRTVSQVPGTSRARVVGFRLTKTSVWPGVVTLTHGWGGLPEENLPPEVAGTNTNLLVPIDRHAQTINGMVRFSGVPVRVRRAESVNPSERMRA